MRGTSEFTFACPTCRGNDRAAFEALPLAHRGLVSFDDEAGHHDHYREHPAIPRFGGQSTGEPPPNTGPKPDVVPRSYSVNARTGPIKRYSPPPRRRKAPRQVESAETTRIRGFEIETADLGGDFYREVHEKGAFRSRARGRSGSVTETAAMMVGQPRLRRTRGRPLDRTADSEAFSGLYDAFLPRVRVILRLKKKVERQTGRLTTSRKVRRIELLMGAVESAGDRDLPAMPTVTLADGKRSTTNTWLVQRTLDESERLGSLGGDRPAPDITAVIVEKLCSRGPGKGPGEYDPSSRTPVRIVRHRRRRRGTRIL